MTTRGPRRSISRPTSGLKMAETRKPNENAPAVTPRSQPNSSRIGGEGGGKGGGAVAPPAPGAQEKATLTPPIKKGNPGVPPNQPATGPPTDSGHGTAPAGAGALDPT